ncbi:MAG: polysaccharide biosynthesis tyrosine autokinase [Alphaproteobacteria bacterium]|nr:polysaccharide biosynthesis tyrosine autokinase [Alphaproteobacteria bacterium]
MALKFKTTDRSLGQILSALWRRKLLIAGAALAFALGGLLVARQMPQTFVADGSLILETQQLTLPDVRSQFTNPFSLVPGDPSSIVRSQILIMRSRSIIESVVMELGLTTQPELNPYLRPPGRIAQWLGGLRGTLPAGMVGTLDDIGLRLPRPLQREPTPEEVIDATVRGVLQRLDVNNDARSFVIALSFLSEDPQLAARVVNTVMESYITAQIAAKMQATADANAYLNERIAQLRREVDAADQAVQDYRQRHGLVDTRQGTVTQQQLAELNTQLIIAQAEATTAEANLRSAGSGAASTLAVNSSLISRLREREAEAVARQSDLMTRLGPNHPQRQIIDNELRELRTQITTETERIRQSLANQATAARSRVGALQAQLRAIQGTATRSAESEAQLALLLREADAKRTIYQRFQETAQQTAQPSRSNQADARIVTVAVAPSNPNGPKTAMFVGSGGVVGLLLAAALALLLGELDRGYERVEEIESATGLPALGALPLVRWKRSSKSLVDFVLHNPASAAAETVRGIVEAMRRADTPEPPKILLITSALAGEGKTSLTAAIGRVLAKDGRRVLVIEADFRRPQIGELFDQPAGRLDFEDVLGGHGAWTDAVQTDMASGLHYLCAAEATDSPQAMLSSPAWGSIVADARRTYDLVLIDTPPVMSVTDTVVLARHCDAIALVIGWRSTQRRTIDAAIKRLRRVERPLAGFVLSKVQGTIEVVEYYAGYYGPAGKPRRTRRTPAAAKAAPEAPLVSAERVTPLRASAGDGANAPPKASTL